MDYQKYHRWYRNKRTKSKIKDETMGFFKRIIDWFAERRKQRRLKKRLEELRKRDPFIYK